MAVYSFARRRLPDLVTQELVFVLSQKRTYEFKKLFEVVYDNLRGRNAANGGQEMLRLRAYEKLQYLVLSGAVKKDGKIYTGNSAALAAIAANTARFGQLDDYYIFDEVTVYFANGKVKVDPKYNPQLLALADKAKTINGYLIEVKGYASAVGSITLNQRLSEDRANQVTNILLQQGHIPLTRMLAPGAMGESHPVGNNETEQGQSENRRVVVRVLQNKAIAGV